MKTRKLNAFDWRKLGHEKGMIISVRRMNMRRLMIEDEEYVYSHGYWSGSLRPYILPTMYLPMRKD